MGSECIVADAVGDILCDCPHHGIAAEVAGSYIGKGVGEVRKLFLEAAFNGDLARGHDEGILAVAHVGELDRRASTVHDGEAIHHEVLIGGDSQRDGRALGAVLWLAATVPFFAFRTVMG